MKGTISIETVNPVEALKAFIKLTFWYSVTIAKAMEAKILIIGINKAMYINTRYGDIPEILYKIAIL